MAVNMKFYCITLALIVTLADCSSAPQPKTGPATSTQTPRVAASSNPVAKYIELSGLRITEKGPGKLIVHLAVINHSEADVGNIAMIVNLRPTTAKPDDAPLASFNARVNNLGPEDLKEVSVEVPTKLRVYELPDWQFIRAEFQITEPK
jgi:hypothetical protein